MVLESAYSKVINSFLLNFKEDLSLIYKNHIHRIIILEGFISR